MRRERSCGVVAYRHREDRPREFLLLHYPGGHWDFPKGHMEKGETEEQTARRELVEETGLADVDVAGGFRRVVRYRFRGSRKQMIDKSVVFFAGRVDGDQLKISHEHKGYTWLPYEQALERLTFRNAKGLLTAAEQFLQASAKASSKQEAEA